MELFVIITFIFGLIVGSFLNVVILRYNTGKSVNGRSGCLTCGSKLEFIDLIPVLSFIFLKGRCRKCGSKISTQYPLVELGTGIMFSAIFIKYPHLLSSSFSDLMILVFFYIFFSLLIVIFAYDIKHKIIPNGIVYTLAILALIYRIFITDLSSLELINILDLSAGIIFFVPFFLLWFLSRGRWIGLGDGKLALSIGWLLGFVHGLSAIIIAFWVGAIISVTILLILRLKGGGANITMKTEIPFAPFLIFGILLMFFFPYDVLGVSLFF